MVAGRFVGRTRVVRVADEVACLCRMALLVERNRQFEFRVGVADEVPVDGRERAVIADDPYALACVSVLDVDGMAVVRGVNGLTMGRGKVDAGVTFLAEVCFVIFDVGAEGLVHADGLDGIFERRDLGRHI